MSAAWLVALLSFAVHAACPPIVDLSHDWVNASNGLKTPVPSAWGAAARFVLRITNTDSTDTAINLVLIDSLPTYLGTASLASLPAGWSADLTQSGTGGSLVGRFTAAELAPGTSVTIMVDLSLTSSGCPINMWSSDAFAASSGICSTVVIATPARTAIWAIFGHYNYQVKIHDMTGSAVKAFPVSMIGCSPASLQIGFGAGTGCGAPVADPSRPLTPDGDCMNDRLLVSINATAGGPITPMQVAIWDGRDDGGGLVPCGSYSVRLSSIGSMGEPIVLTRPIEVGCAGWEQVGGSVRIIGGLHGTLSLLGGGESVRDRAVIAVRATGAGEVSARLYDRAGRLVREFSGIGSAGRPVIFEWDGRDRAGRDVAPGIYSVLISGPGVKARERIAVVP